MCGSQRLILTLIVCLLVYVFSSLVGAYKYGDSQTHSDKSASRHEDSQTHSDNSASRHGDSQTHSDNSAIKHGDSQTHSDKSAIKHGDSQTHSDNSAIRHGDSQTHSDHSAIKHGDSQTHSNNSAIRHGDIQTHSDNSAIKHGDSQTHSDNSAIKHGDSQTHSDKSAIRHGDSQTHSDKSAIRHGDSQTHSNNSAIRQGTSQLLYTKPEQPLSHMKVRSQSDVDRTEKTAMECRILGTAANCSQSNLHDVPDHLPANITRLDLSCNAIATLRDNVFAPYFHLQHLNISSNRLQALRNFSFQNLSSLISLDLHNNQLEMKTGVYPDDVFESLKSLQNLNISSNSPNLTKTGLAYPDVALSRLTSLLELHMDGLNVDISGPLGPGFQKLRRLTNLTLAGYTTGNCSMRGLRNDTFENVKYLEHLSIADCLIHGNQIDREAFSKLTSLRWLDLSHNEDIDINNLNLIYYGLRNARNLSHLHMHLVSTRYSLSVCLDSKYMENFPPNLVYLDARENNLEAIDRYVLDKLASVEELNLSGNRFVFGAYLSYLPKLKRLRSLKLSGEQSLYNLPRFYPYYLKQERRDDHPVSNCSLYTKDKFEFVLKLPPRLEYLEMNNAGLKYILSTLNVSEENTLKNLSLSGNQFPYLDGPIYGLHSLKYLDLSFSFVSQISEKFFQNLTTLEVLMLHSNLLGSIFAQKGTVRVFSYLTNLKILDLSFNAIEAIRPDAFLELRNLTTLLLARNPLTAFEVQISHMNSLKMLNLSSTHISSLPVTTQQHITYLIDKGVNVTVDLSYVQIYCDCINLRFLIWMTSCGAFRIEPKKYFCSFRDLTGQIIIDGYTGTISMLNKQCISVALLILISGCCCVLMVVFVIGVIIFRFRWNIRYIYYAAYLRYKNMAKPAENHFEFDCFVCYAEEDMEFVENILDKALTERGLKTLLHRRDFTAGELISSNIVEAVSRSRRTVVVLTRFLMESHWCRYEVEMAKMEGVYSGRQVLVFLIMEEIPRQKLGRDLLYNIKNNTYLEYPSLPHDADQMKVWWDKLVNDITE